MAVITKKQLLEAGVHFGHNTRRWNPKMKEYIYEERNGIYIIDLTKTEVLVEEAYKALYTIVQNGGSVLFVGTRKQTQDVIKEEATRAEQFYVDQRWLGGTLTNFKTIKRSIARLFKIEEMEQDGTFDVLPKKEVILLKKEKEKLDKFFNGIKNMKELPQALVVVDPKTEHNAVAEAHRLNIPVFGLVDTNCDPDEVDYVIPANDDAIRSVKLIVATMANAVVEANGGTPIVIEFTDDMPQDERPHQRNNRQGGRDNRGNRNYKDRNYQNKGPRPERTTTPKTDVVVDAPVETEVKAEVKVEEEVKVEVQEQPKKVKKEKVEAETATTEEKPAE